MREGVVVGSLTYRAVLCFAGKEVVVSSKCESVEEVLAWGRDEWASIQKRLSLDELQRLGWTTPELRYWM